MEHSFDVEIAKRYGIPCAVLLKNIYFWIEKNRANNKNFYDGNYWTYNSKKAFAELFPYLNERQIDYALKKLLDEGVIVTGNYNKVAYDRTLWYAITKKGYSILQNCEMDTTKLLNGTNKIVEPIPDIITNNKLTDNKTNSNNNIIKSGCPDNAPIVKDIIEYLNSLLGTKFSYKTAKTQRDIKARLNENNYTLEDFKIVIDKKYKEWKGTEFEKYLRPETLFGTKFESYLNQKQTYKKQDETMDILAKIYNELED